MSNFITFICMSLNLSAAFIFGCTGETITEKVGHLNMGIPGIMCLGMCGAVVGANIYCTAGLNNGFLAYLLVFLIGVYSVIHFLPLFLSFVIYVFKSFPSYI